MTEIATLERSGGLRAWLMSASPRSSLQARCQRSYLAWLAFRANPIAMTGLIIIVALVLMAILAPLLTRTNGLGPELENRLQPFSAEHWFGTDQLGRDIYDRIVWGSRITLYIVGLVSLIVVPIGVAVGTIAGYVGGWVDNVLMRITDIFLAFPRLILALALVAALGPGIENAVLAIALTTWSPYARIARAETLTIRKADFILAAQAQGASDPAHPAAPRRAPLPGLGYRSPDAGHGRDHPDRGRPGLSRSGGAAAIAGMGRDDLQRTPIVVGPMVGADLPGIAIFVVSLGFSLLGDGLRDVLDPKRAEK